jgi:hypothetical protein
MGLLAAGGVESPMACAVPHQDNPQGYYDTRR